jgi:hypothetical protein
MYTASSEPSVSLGTSSRGLRSPFAVSARFFCAEQLSEMSKLPANPARKCDSQLSGLSVHVTRSSIDRLRRLAVLYMQTQPDAFQLSARAPGRNFEEYLGGSGKAIEWGDDSTLLAMASALRIAIHVVSGEGRSTQRRRLRVSHRLILPLGGPATHTIFLHEWRYRKRVYYEGLAEASTVDATNTVLVPNQILAASVLPASTAATVLAKAAVAPAGKAKDDDELSQCSAALSEASTKPISEAAERVQQLVQHEVPHSTADDSAPRFAPQAAPSAAAHSTSTNQRPTAAAERNSFHRPCLEMWSHW